MTRKTKTGNEGAAKEAAEKAKKEAIFGEDNTIKGSAGKSKFLDEALKKSAHNEPIWHPEEENDYIAGIIKDVRYVQSRKHKPEWMQEHEFNVGKEYTRKNGETEQSCQFPIIVISTEQGDISVFCTNYALFTEFFIQEIAGLLGKEIAIVFKGKTVKDGRQFNNYVVMTENSVD